MSVQMMHCQFGRDKPGTAGARLGITRVQGSTLSNQRALTVSEIFTVMRLVPVRWGFRASNETVIRSPMVRTSSKVLTMAITWIVGTSKPGTSTPGEIYDALVH